MKQTLQKWMQSHRKNLLVFLAAAVVSTTMGATLATIVHDMELRNALHTPTVTTKITEDLKDNGKVVRFENTGTADAFLRMSFAEGWVYTGTNEDGAIEKEILSNTCRTSNQTETEYLRAAVPQWLKGIGEVDSSGTVIGAETDPKKVEWEYNPKDGWWYYKKVLPAGEKNETGEILQKVDFTNIAQFAENDQKKYYASSYDLHFTIEVVQASDELKVSEDAIQATFKSAKLNLTNDQKKDWKTTKDSGAMFDWDFELKDAGSSGGGTEAVKGGE